MPELPEVETLSRAIRNTLQGTTITGLTFFRPDLREPIPIQELRDICIAQPVLEVFRRSKYLVIQTPRGFAILHLGMTGNLLYRTNAEPTIPHTHAVISFIDKKGCEGFLHFVDPRRFGRFSSIQNSNLDDHPYIRDLGPEPLPMTVEELGSHLFQKSRNKKIPVKNFIMDAKILVGVGNIYASESLFRAGISPKRRAGSVSSQRYRLLASAIQDTLKEAIEAGGTSFRDFKNSSGEKGYFSINLNVYGREGEPCPRCQKKILLARQGGRSTFYCGHCQN